MTAQLYQYRPLDTAQRQIRLITVLPPKDNGDPVLKLEHTAMEDADNAYSAISYTWGQDTPSHQVWIGDQYILLRENIWRFLLHYCRVHFRDMWVDLEEQDHPRLWIDSICINQNDTQEKNLQVRLMARIFGQARSVLIWLSQISEQRSPQKYDYKSFKRRRGSKNSSRFHYQTSTAHVYNWRSLREIRDRIIPDDLVHLLRNPYWERLWIVQEIILARAAFIIMGYQLVAAAAVSDALHDDDAHNAFFGAGEEYSATAYGKDLTLMSVIRKIVNFSGTYKTGRKLPQPLDWLIKDFSSQKCYDPRDRIFGLLGMTRLSETFDVDYACTIPQLAVKVLEVIKREYLDAQQKNFNSQPECASVNLDDLLSALNLTLEDFVDTVGGRILDSEEIGEPVAILDDGTEVLTIHGAPRRQPPGIVE